MNKKNDAKYPIEPFSLRDAAEIAFMSFTNEQIKL